MYLPFNAGGGYLSISGNNASLSAEVEIFVVLLLYTSTAISTALSILCFVRAETKRIGICPFGAILCLISFSKSMAVFVSL